MDQLSSAVSFFSISPGIHGLFSTESCAVGENEQNAWFRASTDDYFLLTDATLCGGTLASINASGVGANRAVHMGVYRLESRNNSCVLIGGVSVVSEHYTSGDLAVVTDVIEMSYGDYLGVCFSYNTNSSMCTFPLQVVVKNTSKFDQPSQEGLSCNINIDETHDVENASIEFSACIRIHNGIYIYE